MMISRKLLHFGVLLMIAAIGFAVMAQGGSVTFQSTQFNVVEESEKARAILAGFDGEISFVASE